LWRSFTGGRGALAWERVSTGFPVLAVSSIAFAPNESNTMYIGTGNTWRDFNEGVTDAFLVYDLRTSNSNRKIRAVTHGNGVYECVLLPDITSEVESPQTPMTNFRLEQNYPNPFNPATRTLASCRNLLRPKP
jgi:hypothetical protein